MGLFGMQIGKALGGVAGKALGGVAGGLIGGKQGRKIGSQLGGQLGSTAGAVGGAGLTAFKKGGMVKKTAPALLHKGELVVPAKMVKDVSKALKKKIRANQKKK